MAVSKLYFLLVSICLVSLACAASVVYEEPTMEAEAGSMQPDDENGNGLSQEESEKDNEVMDNDIAGEEYKDNMEDKDLAEEKKKEEIEIKKKVNKADPLMEGENDDENSEKSAGNLMMNSSSKKRDTNKKSSNKNDEETNCKVSEAIKSMTETLSSLSAEITGLKEQMKAKCSETGGVLKDEDSSEESQENEESSGDDEDKNKADNLEASGDGEEGSKEKTDKKESKCEGDDEDKKDGKDGEAGEDDGDSSTTPAPTLPPPPESCPAPFQLLASSCYYIQTDSREWRSWGEAQAFCQRLEGSLAGGSRMKELREYLQQSYSSTFWVGARNTGDTWSWLSGAAVTEEDWRIGNPSKQPSRRCVYLDSFSNYRGVDYYCGEKFSFVCEHEGE